MKKILILAMAALLIAGFLPTASYAGPWTLEKGKVWTEVFTRMFTSKYYYDYEYTDHKWDSGGRSTIYDVETKFEYGATDDLNLLLGIPYSWSTFKNDWGKYKNQDFKQISTGAKYRFMKKPAVAAVQVKAFIQPRNSDRNLPPAITEYGDGIEVRGLIGQSWNVFNGKQFYMAGESGYFWRSKWISQSDYANYVPIFFEAGFAPWKWLMWKGELDCQISHQGTGKVKDTYTWRTGPIINLLGKGFSSIEKGEDMSSKQKFSFNVELQYGRTFLARGDKRDHYNGSDAISQAQEFVAKFQFLF